MKLEEREPRLQTWFEAHKENLPEMSWFEFSACAGSTLESSVLSHMPFMMNYMMKILRKLDKDIFLTYKDFISYLIISLIKKKTASAGI